jgi:lipid-A-disaccharide synthase-like uncharacterized protein
VAVGVGLVLVGLVLTLSGVGALFSSSLFGDYNLTDSLPIEESSRAVVTDDLELPSSLFLSSSDELRVEGVATGSNELFMGIAPADAVAGYLDGVAHDQITDWDFFTNNAEDVVYIRNEGTTDPAAPGTVGFWVASVSGSGELTLGWTIQTGEWALVIMNADGSPGVSADVRLGVPARSVLLPIGVALVVVGLVALIGGVRLISSLPARPDETPRWTVRGHSVLPTTLEGRVAVLCAVLFPVPFFGPAMFGALIFLILALRKGDRGLLLVLPLLASIVVAMFAVVLIFQIPGA